MVCDQPSRAQCDTKLLGYLHPKQRRDIAEGRHRLGSNGGRCILLVLRKGKLGEQQHRGKRTGDARYGLLAHSYRNHRRARALHLGRVVDTIDRDTPALVQQREFVNRRLEMDRRALVFFQAGEELVEDVVVSLALRLLRDARLLEQVDVDPRARHAVRS